MAMEIWMPAQPEQEARFWKPSSESEEGSIWIPSPESEGSFWKPSGVSICKPSPFWKGNSAGGSVSGWKPSSSSESEGVGGVGTTSSSSSGSSSESEEEHHHPSLEYKITNTWSNWYCDEPIGTVQRRFRRDAARLFRKEYKFENGKKTVIRSNGVYTCCGKCFPLAWVAVHGTDSVCVVTRNKEVDMKRVGSYYQLNYTNEQTLRCLTEALISETECLPYDDDEFRGKGIEKPFAVVSVIPDTKRVNAQLVFEDLSGEYDEKAVIAYIQEKMKYPSPCVLKKTIRRAMYAFQVLFGQQLLAEDIWVTVLDGKGRVHHLELLDKMRHLAVVLGKPLLSTTDLISDDLW